MRLSIFSAFYFVNWYKKLNIFGAGYNIDSSAITGNTVLSGNIIIDTGANNGSLEGLYLGELLTLNNMLNQYSITRCFIGNIILGNGSGTLPYNITLSSIIINGSLNAYLNNNGASPKNVFILNSIIGNGTNSNVIGFSGNSGGHWNSLTCKNSIFQGSFYYNVYTGGAMGMLNVDNSTFDNCVIIDRGTTAWAVGNNVYANCIFNKDSSYNMPSLTNLVYNCHYSINADSSIFIKVPKIAFDIHNNYHLLATSIGKNGGTDGTDIGIYGGSTPWVEGGVPSNPHIYYKKIAAQSNANGKLSIQFKVRANNY